MYPEQQSFFHHLRLAIPVQCGTLSRGSVKAPVTVLFKDGLSTDKIFSFSKLVDDTPNSKVFAGSAYQDKVLMF